MDMISYTAARTNLAKMMEQFATIMRLLLLLEHGKLP